MSIVKHITLRYKIEYQNEKGLLVAYHYYDGKFIERQVIAQVEPVTPVIDSTVLNAVFKAMLATAAMMAILAGHSELALGIIYILKSLIEREQH